MKLGNLKSKLSAFPDQLLDYLRPTKPNDILLAQPESFAALLPYECVLPLERATTLLSDGSVGIIWELDAISHEVTDSSEITRRTKILAEICDKIRDPDVSMQFIFDAEPSADFPVPGNILFPQSSAEKILAHRVAAIRDLADQPKDRLRLMRRRIFLTLRLSPRRRVSYEMGKSQEGKELFAVTEALTALSKKLFGISSEVEYNLSQGGFNFQPLDASDTLRLLRETCHSLEDRKTSAMLAPEAPNPRRRLSSQIMRGFSSVSPRAIGVGEDSWEVCSWLDQPSVVYQGLWARLMEIDTPHRLVVNVRPCLGVGDLDTKRAFLKQATDAYGELQREEVRVTQDALARGESLSWVSVHLLVRNVGKTPVEMGDDGKAKVVASQLKTMTQVPFLVERHAAPAIFLLSLPLGFSAAGAGFSGRERRVLSRNLAPYLPVFGPFKGTKTPFQLMVSRGGSPVWLNPFDSETSPHLAVLASSGGGKSFFAQNLMMSFFAKHAQDKMSPLLFIIDKKTSYEIFTQVLGEDVGSQLVKPPEYYPNIFRGKLDDFRLPVIVGLLKTAVSLVAEDAKLGAVEEMLIADAVRLTFEQNELDAKTEYSNGCLKERLIGKVRIPRLSDVKDNLFSVAAERGVSLEVATTLAHNLAPFIGQGPYAALFDRKEEETFDPPTPGVSLYDVDAVSSNVVLCTLTTQMILVEILRQIRRPENRGRPGMLVIEEAGVLAGTSPEIVSFIQDAWKTFRKLGFSCMGLTNEVDDFARKPGPREIWNVSPNKIILRMLDKDRQKALSGDMDAGLPPLIEDENLGKLIGTLSKKDGSFSQGLWWSDEVKGTFVFHPTGFDYWCAASKPIEVETFYRVKAILNCSFFKAVEALALSYPNGVRAEDGSLRRLSESEVTSLKGEKP